MYECSVNWFCLVIATFAKKKICDQKPAARDFITWFLRLKGLQFETGFGSGVFLIGFGLVGSVLQLFV